MEFYDTSYQFAWGMVIQTFINPFSYYVFDKKSQQVFHMPFVINVIIIVVDAHKNYKSVHPVTIIAQ